MRQYIALLVVTLVAPSWQLCDPTKCLLPKCRCFNDPKAPGDLSAADIPQMVIVTMENNLNKDTWKMYESLFKGIANPNRCAVRGTFFIEDDGSDYGLVKTLFDQGYEIGINSVDGTTPSNATAFNQMIKTVKQKLAQVQIEDKNVYGVRVTGLAIGGDAELTAIGDNNLLYESSCINVQRSQPGLYLWPYTFDYPPTQKCDIGQAPTLPFPGKWEMFLADLHDLTDDKLPCAAPSACRNITTKKDAFDLFFNAFEDHYKSNRAPFVMVVDPAWAKNNVFRDGTVEFLQYIRAGFGHDVWIVTAIQALQWVQNPTAIANVTDFKPWGC